METILNFIVRVLKNRILLFVLVIIFASDSTYQRFADVFFPSTETTQPRVEIRVDEIKEHEHDEFNVLNELAKDHGYIR